MPTLDVRNRDNKVVGNVDVAEAVFGRAVKRSVLHEAVVQYQASVRRGTHATKTRSEVAGSDHKPWRQKGTGRSRHGTRRSPLWRKGGVTFGPQPRNYGYSIPRRKMRLGLQMALSAKRDDGAIVVVDELEIGEAKTREVARLLAGLELNGKTLIYDPEGREEFQRAARNIPGVKVVSGYGLTVYDLLACDQLLTSKAGISRIDEALR